MGLAHVTPEAQSEHGTCFYLQKPSVSTGLVGGYDFNCFYSNFRV